MMRNIKKYGSLLLLSVVLLAACSKQKVQPKNADVNSEDVQGSRAVPDGCILVKNVQNLLDVKKNLSACYEQTDNINLDGINFDPIGDANNPFTGRYNGKGKTISNLKINKIMNNLGLFSYAIGATFDSIKLENIQIIGSDTSSHVGGLVGYMIRTKISNSSATGNIRGYDKVGGLVGMSTGWQTAGIFNSYTKVLVSGNSWVGGLIGIADALPIANSYATGNVSGGDGAAIGGVGIGGLVGSIINATIYYSAATGNISGVHQVGGLVGNNSGEIFYSYATGNVSGTLSEIGGLVGAMTAGFTSGRIANSYATGNVSGFQYVGGLIGSNLSLISNSYATGDVTGYMGVGGLIGRSWSGTIYNNYATGIVQGNSLVGGFIGDDGVKKLSNNFQAHGSVYQQGQNVIGTLPTPMSLVRSLKIYELNQALFQNAGWFENAEYGSPTPWNTLTSGGFWPTLKNTGPNIPLIL